MTDNGEKEKDDAPEKVPATHPTDGDEDREKEGKDAAVDETSEQSMDASDPPAW